MGDFELLSADGISGMEAMDLLTDTLAGKCYFSMFLSFLLKENYFKGKDCMVQQLLICPLFHFQLNPVRCRQPSRIDSETTPAFPQT
jgi:hypothetical protein